MSLNFQDVSVPTGAYISWDARPGQVVTGIVTAYAADGGTDFNGLPCPQVSLELLEDAYSVNKMGERTDFPAGEHVVINAGQASLKRAITAARLEPGDGMRLEFVRMEQLAGGRSVKVFDIKKAPGARKDQVRQSLSATEALTGQPEPSSGWDVPATPAQPAAAPAGDADLAELKAKNPALAAALGHLPPAQQAEVLKNAGLAG